MYRGWSGPLGTDRLRVSRFDAQNVTRAKLDTLKGRRRRRSNRPTSIGRSRSRLRLAYNSACGITGLFDDHSASNRFPDTTSGSTAQPDAAATVTGNSARDCKRPALDAGGREDPAVLDRPPHADIPQSIGADFRRIVLQHGEVGALAAFDGADLAVELEGIGGAQRDRA